MWWNRRTRIDRWSAREVQQLLRQFGAEARDLAAVMAVLGVSQMEAHRMLNELSRAGYVARDPASVDEPRWHRTREGDEFAETGLGPPLSRARAERLLQRVIRRVVTVNRQPHLLCRVTAVGVCGAHLTEAPVLEALELVVRIVPKPPAPGTANAVFRPDRRLPYWDLQKQLPPDEWPHWRERHVELYLLARERSLVLHRLGDRVLRGQHVRLVFLALSDGPVVGAPGRDAPDGPCGNSVP
jgi:DNA-binding MarR family transcriptional regulator